MALLKIRIDSRKLSAAPRCSSVTVTVIARLFRVPSAPSTAPGWTGRFSARADAQSRSSSARRGPLARKVRFDFLRKSRRTRSLPEGRLRRAKLAVLLPDHWTRLRRPTESPAMSETLPSARHGRRIEGDHHAGVRAGDRTAASGSASATSSSMSAGAVPAGHTIYRESCGSCSRGW